MNPANRPNSPSPSVLGGCFIVLLMFGALVWFLVEVVEACR